MEIPPKYSVSGFMGFLKGVLVSGHYALTAGKNAMRIAAYIQSHLKEDN
ncbi:MAG: hypothetical protein M0P13_06790 [Fibrobacteraceae bacterium]|nr:hypothetical protein [Fibrobacteraceae bacterium]